jgi:GAF domain-containing protein/HAMP domain-containing protein
LASLAILILGASSTASLIAFSRIAIRLTHLGVADAAIAQPAAANASIPALEVLAAAAPAAVPALILATLSLFKPTWTWGHRAWLGIILLLLILLPWVLAGLDLLAAPLESLVLQAYLLYLRAGLLLLLVYLSFFDRNLALTRQPMLRPLARWLLAASLLAWLIDLFLLDIVPAGLPPIISGLIISLGFAFVTYRQGAHAGAPLRPERQPSAASSVGGQPPSSRLPRRLAALIAAVAIPTLIFVAWFLVAQAGDLLTEKSHSQLEQHTGLIQTSIDGYIHDYLAALQNLARQPDILSMDPARQTPVLQALAATYPSIYLAATTDLSGMNLARSDDEPLLDYSDRLWFQHLLEGADSSLQTLVDPTTGQPALLAAVPIIARDGQLLGVCMSATLLTDLSQQVLTPHIGETDYAYVVDDQGRLVAHPDLLPGSTQLSDWTALEPAAPLASLRQGVAPPLVFLDQDGVEWIAWYNALPNGWGVVVQQQRFETLAPLRTLQSIAIGFIALASLLLLAMLAIVIRQALRPVDSLARAVEAIASGDLTRVAPIESDDEFGALAQGFNSMTLQVRALVDGLERRVAERTLDVEHRSAQLQAAAQVGRAAANIRDLDQLLPLVTRLISERFGFYHVGVFLLDENQEYAVLRAANSEGGQKMLTRGHRLQVGQQGIVGFVCKQRQPRIALNVGEDAVYFSNPDLPATQSEISLPLVVGDVLLGALDVQSTEQAAFSEQDVRTLQVLADQVAIAINSARLVQQLEQVLAAERRAYGEISQRAWQLQARSLPYRGFSRTPAGVIPILGDDSAHAAADPAVLTVPLKVRGVVIGNLKLTRSEADAHLPGSQPTPTRGLNPLPTTPWIDEDIELMHSLAEQLGVALESARAYQSTQADAQRDRLLAEINTRLRERLDVEAILRTTSQELRRALDLSKVVVQLTPEPLVGADLRVRPEGVHPPNQSVPPDSDQGGSHE